MDGPRVTLKCWTSTSSPIQFAFQHADHVIIITTANIVLCDGDLHTIIVIKTRCESHAHEYLLRTPRGKQRLCRSAINCVNWVIAKQELHGRTHALARHTFHVSRDYMRLKMAPRCLCAYFKNIDEVIQHHILEKWFILWMSEVLVHDVLAVIFTKLISKFRRRVENKDHRTRRLLKRPKY